MAARPVADAVTLPESEAGRDRRALDLFEELVEIEDPAARAAAVVRVRERDPSLADAVAALLDADQGPPPPDAEDDPLVVGAEYGAYRVLGVLGDGATSRVYLAEEPALRRRVALKVLRSESPGAARRLRREAALAASLAHPAIAAVFAGGDLRTAEGARPFVAMEAVEGRRIDDYVRRAGLDARATVELFVAALDGVAHAHARGVLHRDLKPSNLLVDSAGRPRIVDFGIAAALRDPARRSGATTLAPALGTPPYCSPEQTDAALGAEDARTDVYALGMTLYELLADRPALDVFGVGLFEALRRVREIDPTPLRRVRPRTPRDLAAVVARATDKDPARRYADAAAFAADLRRHLEGRPVAARPVGPLSVAWRAVRRRPRAAAAAAVTLAALAFAAGVRVARDAETARDLARNRAAAEETVALADGAEDQGVRVDFRIRLLTTLLPRVRALRAAAPDDPAAALLEGRTLLRVGEAEREYGDYVGAALRHAEARALLAAAAARPDADCELRRRAAEAEVRRGDLEGERGFLLRARARYATAHAELAALRAAFPDAPRVADDASWSLERTAGLALRRGDVRTADALTAERVAFARALRARDPRDRTAAHGLAAALRMRADVLFGLGETEAATALQVEARPLADELLAGRTASDAYRSVAAAVAESRGRARRTDGDKRRLELEALLENAERARAAAPDGPRETEIAAVRLRELADYCDATGDAARCGELERSAFALYDDLMRRGTVRDADAAATVRLRRDRAALFRDGGHPDPRGRDVEALRDGLSVFEDQALVLDAYRRLGGLGRAVPADLESAARRFSDGGEGLWRTLHDLAAAAGDGSAAARYAAEALARLPDRPTPARARLTASLAVR